jgi:predicted RNase H-like nuclease (RuvC/YqgF family)|tara:strand:- start:8037 stop:8516 length:480 start_codon:yes stop_codon:yes gene_type:complete
MRKYIKIEMESQISSLFSSILTTIKDYEDRTNKQIAKHDTIIQEKDQQIQVLNDLKQKQQNEMEDFLKVSYATRWKNAAEEFEKKNVHLQDKIESLTRTNEKLNSKLDSLTELVSEETQTDCNEEKVVTIKTKKGAIYILQNGQLLKDNKLVGEVVINE